MSFPPTWTIPEPAPQPLVKYMKYKIKTCPHFLKPFKSLLAINPMILQEGLFAVCFQSYLTKQGKIETDFAKQEQQLFRRQNQQKIATYFAWIHPPDVRVCVTDGLMQEMQLFNITCQWWGIFVSEPVKPAKIAGSMVFFLLKLDSFWNSCSVCAYVSMCFISFFVLCFSNPSFPMKSLSLHPISSPFHMTFAKF